MEVRVFRGFLLRTVWVGVLRLFLLVDFPHHMSQLG